MSLLACFAYRCNLRNLWIALVLLIPVVADSQTQYVNPFVGTAGHGHTFPGASRPFGMVQLSPDTRLTGWDSCAGYHHSDDIIYGFSHTHLSGTGIPDYADILFMPTIGDVALSAFVDDHPDKGYASPFSHKEETARPGYYSVRLKDGNIFAEMTVTNRVGFHRYTFPPGDRANIILDLQHRDRVLDSSLRIVDATHIEGFRRSTGWAKDQIVYFVAEFSQPFSSSGISEDGKPAIPAKDRRGTDIKAFFTFDTRNKPPILVKVALSSVSIDGARRNLAAELPHWDFDRIKAEADLSWNRELNRIQIKGGTAAQQTIFYTALYHAMLAPNVFMDIDGQFRGLDFKTHTAQGFTNYTVFSLWDTFRAAHPLYAIIDQKRSTDFIRTFLAQYEHGGRLPVWELAANETDTMIGYHAVPVIVDAAMKGIGGFDRGKAFAAMKHSAELRRDGLAAYVDHGYISTEDERESVSKTLEYAYDDWCIAQMARALGRQDDYRLFIQRGQFYRNVFDSEIGFMRPRRNGGWLAPFDPREVNSNFTEANSWQYTFFVPQDISGLIELMGGKSRFVRKLDEMFSADSRTTGRDQADITGLIGQYAHGNEPSHHMAYLYNYAGQPWKTQHRVRQIMDEFYTAEPDGLIGNEDCGQMSAWYVFSTAGLYPVTPGQPSYAIGTPLFPEIRFNLESGRSFTIKARGVSAKNFYIQSATLNGRPYRRSYLLHRDLMDGGELIFQMGPRPNQNWGNGDSDAPVSAISDSRLVAGPIIDAPSQIFRDRMTISLTPRTPGDRIYFTTDGTKPNSTSQVYRAPFTIAENITVKAIALNQSNQASIATTATFHKLPHDWSIKYLSRYSPQYTGGGDLALIDGIRGNTNFTTGAWQGFQGQDFTAVIDLGKVRDIKRLGAGFLQDVGPWIWMPRRVQFETSIDGQAFTEAAVIENDLSDQDWRVTIRDLVKTIPNRQARYVRVTAQNYGRIPGWHPGHGGQAWIFIDEIIIE
ncbi:MAG TPA: GH92 family glycosyl hydrolase [Pyrinomonadaceae bacterium]|nr:GH92 family glycosyl hydrolase [Pyrinomonadaceae bacterium]